MTFSTAVYGQALDNESPDPAKADGIWLEDPHSAESQAVAAFVMNVKSTGEEVVSTRDVLVTQASLDGLVVEARCDQTDSGGRDSYIVYCERGARATPEALQRAELALSNFAVEIKRDLAKRGFSDSLKKGGATRSLKCGIFLILICFLLYSVLMLTFPFNR